MINVDLMSVVMQNVALVLGF